MTLGLRQSDQREAMVSCSRPRCGEGWRMLLPGEARPCCTFATSGMTAVTVTLYSVFPSHFNHVARFKGRIITSVLQTRKAGCRPVKCMTSAWLSKSLMSSIHPSSHPFPKHADACGMGWRPEACLHHSFSV